LRQFQHDYIAQFCQAIAEFFLRRGFDGSFQRGFALVFFV